MINLPEIEEKILIKLIPDYEEIVGILKSYSDYELMLIENNCPEDIGDLRNAIICEVQGIVIDILFGSIISDWKEFIYYNEDELAYYYSEAIFIEYDDANKAYYISKDTVIDECKNLIKDQEGRYSIKEDIDFRDIISNLNKQFPLKFCEV